MARLFKGKPILRRSAEVTGAYLQASELRSLSNELPRARKRREEAVALLTKNVTGAERLLLVGDYADGTWRDTQMFALEPAWAKIDKDYRTFEGKLKHETKPSVLAFQVADKHENPIFTEKTLTTKDGISIVIVQQ